MRESFSADRINQKLNEKSKWYRALAFLCGLIFAFLCLVKAYSETLIEQDQIKAVADDLQFDRQNRKLIGVGNAVVTQDDIELTADNVSINVDTKEGWSKGHVVLRQGKDSLISGESAYFDFDDRKGTFDNARLYQYPWYGYAEKIEQINKGKVKAHDAYFTSCNMSHPHYDIHAKNVTIYPDDKIVATNVTFRILETPVFWWPYFQMPLNHDTMLNVQPGYSDDFGAYVLTSKGFSINKNIKGTAHLDYYQKRGFGAGVDFDYKFERAGVGQIKLYGIHDKKTPDEKETNPYTKKTKEYRGRVTINHKMRLDPLTVLDVQWNEISDERFLQDFFEGEYREEIDPKSLISIVRNARQYSLLANFQKRTNDFSTVGEKTPEIIFDWLRKPLFGTGFYYTNEEGFVNFNQKQRFAPDGPNTVQFYTDQEISYPFRIMKHYNLIPYVYMRDDIYTKDRVTKAAANRYSAGSGIDLNTKFYRTWDTKGKFGGIEINQLRHLMRPLVSFSGNQIVTKKISDVVATGRGDNLGLQDVITFGVENRIQTKHVVGEQLQRVDLVSFNTYLDLSFGPHNETSRTGADKFTEARQEIILRPYDWLSFRMDTRYDFVSQNVSSNNIDAIFEPGNLFLAIGHRYIKTRETSGTIDNKDNQITVDAMYKLNSRWSLGSYARYEATEADWQEWELRARRDLHDWWLDFGLNVRNSERTAADKQLNKEIFVELILKAYPAINLHTGHRASYSNPRISDTIEGSSQGTGLGDWVTTVPDRSAIQSTTTV
ncbi:MAG: hypothetical protein A3G33_03365 [Omnitrophica bacterium RIFCSPLOWO2_12_FULL_44_17]|uniref:Organic solvent tolerance-like N-terminal domain-containing protein n=1 Tax=Candidatus Danuiimicrobium aquiferis TaxID=1801832 RepID=A0A1G1KTW8_9BACT|nr:MAG: hypothetical protein A3B72_06910 [Omnitrophica bacterium RIFCSPHIGHO2_02_FULL_45_28]OGW90186.1 MAG: hypothetical protein A3E74_06410 [Omnitrophica bacterium RIFCSPHIGHO2_12_FULL_44_12]OGW96356.1 MAG: hypothetical protein A3G33_03365 [Omnitrophica bacterium RIFCSPLOWO2_12_FULL_44_17]OGX04835.1 MAG: hypothetical protein A3J12_07765 [Omnitrophica bacterium RIFCSPLOWO2_02_FULL_44_11]